MPRPGSADGRVAVGPAARCLAGQHVRDGDRSGQRGGEPLVSADQRHHAWPADAANGCSHRGAGRSDQDLDRRGCGVAGRSVGRRTSHAGRPRRGHTHDEASGWRRPRVPACACGDARSRQAAGRRGHYAADVRLAVQHHRRNAVPVRCRRGPEHSQRRRRHGVDVGRRRLRQDEAPDRTRRRRERAIARRPHADHDRGGAGRGEQRADAAARQGGRPEC